MMATEECNTCIYARIGVCFYLKEKHEPPLSKEGKCELYKPSPSGETINAFVKSCNAAC